ncbi:MAG: four helix bundle protein [Cytophagaceae bacterium]|nr:four helix bundle protein [Cytophagaceae bacterium]
MRNRENIIVVKSYAFALRIVRLYKFLTEEKREFVLAKQILRSGTSIGANISEAQSTETKNDFIHKMGIAAKEILETLYWLNLLHDGKFTEQTPFEAIRQDCQELLRITNSIVLTTRQALIK